MFISGTDWDVNGDVVSDGAGGAIATWHTIEDDGFEYDLFAQRVDASGVVQWASDGVEISTANGSQIMSTLVPDGESGAIAAWADSLYDSSTNFDIRAQRLSSSGTLAWTAGGVTQERW